MGVNKVHISYKNGGKVMNTYKIINKVNCCGKTLLNVIIQGRASCIMTQKDYNQMMLCERNYNKELNKIV